MTAQQKATIGRRSTGADQPEEAAAADSEKEDEKRKPRYRESDDVKTYYRVNRYPK